MLRDKVLKRIFSIFSLVAILITTFMPQVSGAVPITPNKNTGPDCIGYIGYKSVSDPEKYDVSYVPYGADYSKTRYPVYFLYSKLDNKDIFCVDYGPSADRDNPLCKDATKSWLSQLDTTRKDDLKTIISLAIHFARNGSSTHSSEINYACTQMLVWDLCAEYGRAIGIPYRNTLGERISYLYFEDDYMRAYYEQWRAQILETVANYYAYPGSKLSEFDSDYFVTNYKTASSKYLLKINTNVQLPSDTSPVEVVNSNPKTDFSQWSLFNSNSKVKYTYNTRLQLALYNQNDPLRGREDLGLLVMNDRHPVKQFNNKWSGTHAYVGIYRSAKSQNQTVIKTEGVAYYIIPQTFKLTGQTKPKGGTVRLKKTDSATGLPIKGAKFQLNRRDPDGILYYVPVVGSSGNYKEDYSSARFKEMETDSNGEIEVKIKTTGSGYKYSFTELTPAPGYQLPSNTKTNEAWIKDGGTQTYEMTNNKIPETYNIEVTKVDATTGKPIKGVTKLKEAEFALKDPDGKYVYITQTSDGVYKKSDSNNYKMKLSKDSKLKITGLEKKGNYTLTELKAPSGYELSKHPLTCNVLGLNNSFTFKNKAIPIPEYGMLGITKKDSKTGQFLSGVVFELLNSNKRPIKESKTNSGGYCEFKELIYGKYYVREKSTLNGYVLDNKLHEVNISADKKIVTLTLYNDPVEKKIKVIKKDNNGKLLSGAEFTLYTKGLFPIIKKSTDNKGEVEFSKLKVGQYILRETKAPNGFRPNSKDIEIDLTKHTSPVYTVTVNNYKAEENIPSTGTKGAMVFLASGLGMIMLAYIFKKRKIYA